MVGHPLEDVGRADLLASYSADVQVAEPADLRHAPRRRHHADALAAYDTADIRRCARRPGYRHD
jgi:hypothetical protein